MKASDNEFPKLILTKGAAPATPDAGTVKVYAKADGLVYAMDDTGAETPLGGGGGGIPDAPSDGSTYGRKDGAWAVVAGGGGSGDVVGPASAANNRIAVFDGTSGKLIKDGGLTIADLYLDGITAAAIASGTVTLNCNGGRARNFTIAMTANATLAVSNLAGAGRATEFECLITQDATGGRTLTLPASFKALGGSDTAIASTANAKTLLSAKTFDNGTTWAYAMQELV